MSNTPPAPKTIGFWIGHEGFVTALHFIDTVEDNHETVQIPVPSLVSGSDKGEIFFWNLKTERTYYRFTGHDKKMIMYLHYYKASLLTQGRDGNIHIWKLINDKWSIINSFKSSFYGFCTSAVFPTESITYLVTPTGDQSFTFYDYETSKVLHSYTYDASTEIETNSLKNREMCMCMKIFLEEKKIFLLMGYDSGHISLWSYEANKEECRLKCHPEAVLCLDYDSKHKNRGISGSVDNIIQVWAKTEENQLLKLHEVTITNPGINAVKIRDDGKIAITAGQDGYLRIFSWKSMKPISVISSHRQPVSSLQFKSKPFGKENVHIFASGSKDKNICLTAVYF